MAFSLRVKKQFPISLRLLSDKSIIGTNLLAIAGDESRSKLMGTDGEVSGESDFFITGMNRLLFNFTAVETQRRGHHRDRSPFGSAKCLRCTGNIGSAD